MPGRCACTVQFTEKSLQKRLTKGGAAGIIIHVAGHEPNMWGISSAGSPVGIKTHPQSDSPATIKFPTKELHPRGSLLGFYGGLAQLGERLHGMQEVSGSIPLFSTKKALYFVGSMVLFFFSAAKNGGCTALSASFSDVLQAVQCSPRVIGASAGQKVPVQLTISSI